MPRRIKGFSLIEVMVAVAIMAIMAGAALPLMVRAVNQQRTQATRDSLKVAFEALFGARDHRVGNMLADFGYQPAVGTTTLGGMIVTPGVRVFGPDLANTKFPWGWNGPYWNGSTTTTALGAIVPADAWGKAISVINSGTTWQVVSGGPDGLLATGGDNLSYPFTAPQSTSYQCTIIITVLNHRDTPVTNIDGSATVQDRTNGNFKDHLQLDWNLAKSGTKVYTVSSLNPGPITVTIKATTPPTYTYEEVVDLLPGQNAARTVEIY